MSFLLFLALLVLIFFVFRRVDDLRKRVEHIERYLQDFSLRESVRSKTYTSAVSDVLRSTDGNVAPRSEQPATSPTQTPISSEGDQTWRDMSRSGTYEQGGMDRFLAWCREDWLMKLGGLFVVLGMAWFVNYAFAEGWIGPMGRIAVGLSAGAVVLALGRFRMLRFVTQGSVLMVVGALTIVLTIFAAQEVYQMFPPTLALLVIFGTSCLLGATSVVMKRRELAYANVLLAGIAPLLVNAPQSSLTHLFTYLFVLALGALWVATVTGWRDLPFISLIIVGLYSLTYLTGWSHELDIGLLFAYAFTALFFGASIAGARYARKVSVIDLLLALGSGVFLLVWILAGATEEWQSMLLVAWTIVFAFGAFLAVWLGAGLAYFYSYASVGVVFIGVATALELDGPTLTIAAILEAGLLLWLGYRITGNVRAVPILALPSVIPVLLSFESLGSEAWRCGERGACVYGDQMYQATPMLFDRIVHSDALVLLLMVVVSCLLGVFFYAERLQVGERERGLLKDICVVMWVVSTLYASVLVWLVSHAIFFEDAGTMVALFIYTIVALAFYVANSTSGKIWHRHVATAFFVFVVGRLLLVDVWGMALAERVVTFLVIGATIIAVAWLARGARVHTR